ncbi:MAG: hypothetical protein N7Q72_04920, partial [Spiroplasma sp. Tabriz.8]|nr:hypothetical protein [Spiroplasma sp. Tabriz.8]
DNKKNKERKIKDKWRKELKIKEIMKKKNNLSLFYNNNNNNNNNIIIIIIKQNFNLNDLWVCIIYESY